MGYVYYFEWFESMIGVKGNDEISFWNIHRSLNFQIWDKTLNPIPEYWPNIGKYLTI